MNTVFPDRSFIAALICAALSLAASPQYPESQSYVLEHGNAAPADYCELTGLTMEGRYFDPDWRIGYYAFESEHGLTGFEIHSNEQSASVKNPAYDEETAGPFDHESVQARRSWYFEFPGFFRDGVLEIVDWPIEVTRNRKTQDLVSANPSYAVRMSMLALFPRKLSPSVRVDEDLKTIEITLTTGEKLILDAISRKVLSGAFQETGLKTNVTPWRRSGLNETRLVYPETQAKYIGRGVSVSVLEADEDPRKPGHRISIRTGSPDPLCLNLAKTTAEQKACSECVLKSEEIWQALAGERLVCFPVIGNSDEEFGRILKEKCGFGIPEI